MKKQIIIFSLIGLAVIIGAVTYYFYVKKSAIKVDNNISDQAQSRETAVPPASAKNISDIIKEAASGGDLTKCDEAANKSLAADCSAQASFSLAIRKKDKKYCENIINKTDKENCFKVLAGMGVK